MTIFIYYSNRYKFLIIIYVYESGKMVKKDKIPNILSRENECICQTGCYFPLVLILG